MWWISLPLQCVLSVGKYPVGVTVLIEFEWPYVS